MIKAAILAGRHQSVPRLVHLLHSHPDVELVAFGNKEQAGQRLDDIFPSMTGETDLRATADIDWKDIDVVFIAAEPGTARSFMRTPGLPPDLCIIDMTGDFRIPDPSHDFVQGIAELNRKAMVRGAKHVAIPDARTLAIALGLLPLAKNLMLNASIRADIVAHDAETPAGSMTGLPMPAGVADELTAALSSLQNSFGESINGISFTGDIPSGLTAVISIDSNVEIEELRKLYDDFYSDHNFTYLIDRRPDASAVRGTNKCFIHLDKADNRLVITTVLDTDTKGTAGNAIHSMNLLFGLIERVGL